MRMRTVLSCGSAGWLPEVGWHWVHALMLADGSGLAAGASCNLGGRCSQVALGCHGHACSNQAAAVTVPYCFTWQLLLAPLLAAWHRQICITMSATPCACRRLLKLPQVDRSLPAVPRWLLLRDSRILVSPLQAACLAGLLAAHLPARPPARWK